MKLQPHADNFTKKDPTVCVFLWYWTTANFEALLNVIKKLDIKFRGVFKTLSNI